MTLIETLQLLPDGFEVVLKPKGGSFSYTETAAYWLGEFRAGRDDPNRYELVTEIHLPEVPEERPDVDWATFWTQTVTEHDWLIEPIIPKGRNVALYAPAGEGKSELSLALACQAATKGISVLYLDFEMTNADLMDRLYDMNYGPETDLTNLHYLLHPPIPTLDTPEGGQALTGLATERDAELIIIDTFMRIVGGNENDSDTLLKYDLYTGRLMKAAKRTVLRLDHSGKDITLGARGTSAKRDDVDLIWRLQRREGGVRLKAEKRRMGWIPEHVDLTRNDFPVTYGQVPASWPEGTKRLAGLLDELNIDPELGRPTVRKILTEHGETAKNSLLSAAIKYRREYHHQLVFLPGEKASGQSPGKPRSAEGQQKGQVYETPGQKPGQSGVSMNDTPPSEKAFSEEDFDEEYDPNDLDDLADPW